MGHLVKRSSVRRVASIVSKRNRMGKLTTASSRSVVISLLILVFVPSRCTTQMARSKKCQPDISFVYEHLNGQWLIEHHHSSVLPEAVRLK